MQSVTPSTRCSPDVRPTFTPPSAGRPVPRHRFPALVLGALLAVGLLFATALATPLVGQDRNRVQERAVERAQERVEAGDGRLELPAIPGLDEGSLRQRIEAQRMSRTAANVLREPLNLAPKPLREAKPIGRVEASAEDAQEFDRGPRVLPAFSVGTAKWGSLALGVASASYGFLLNRRAERAFRPLEGLCTRGERHCTGAGPDGSPLEAGVDADYQRVRSLDGSARTALLAGQIGLGAAVALFILDLAGSSKADVIPFDPPRLRLDRDGAGWEARIPVGGR